MRQLIFFSLLMWSSFLLSSCRSEFNGPTAFSVSGVYQLILYTHATSSDDNPSGTIQVVQTDEEHVDLVIQGQSGKMKINYTYKSVDVAATGDDSDGQTTYNLVYKKHPIGIARVDGVSRYLVLTPSSTLRLEGLEI